MTAVSDTLPFYPTGAVMLDTGDRVAVKDYVDGSLVTIYVGSPIGKRRNRAEDEYCVYENVAGVLWVTRSLLEWVAPVILDPPPIYTPERFEIRKTTQDELTTPQIGLVVMTLFFVLWTID